MEEDVTNGVNYYLRIEASLKNHLAALRSWQNLKVATDDGFIWLTNFTPAQIESTEVKILPSKEVYKSKDNKLFKINSLLPEGKEPTFLWTPIQRAFLLKAPAFNHNYFGTEQQIEIKLIKKETEEPTYGLLTSIDELEKYIATAPDFRLNKLQWTIVDENHVLIIGLPVLPLRGDAYWCQQQHLLPVGYAFELEILIDTLEEKLEVTNGDWVLWKPDTSFCVMRKTDFKSLSLSSVRKTLTHFDNIDKLLDDTR